MSRKITVLGIASIVFVVVLMAFAGTALAAYTPGLHANVADGVHNVAADGQALCDPCHTPHGAMTQTALWSQAPHALGAGTISTSEIAPLCYSCHSTPGMPGQATAFDGSKQIHPIQSYSSRKASQTNQTAANLYGRDCDRCHDPHENTTERPNFIRYQRITTSANKPILILGPDICATCHTGNISGWLSRTDSQIHYSHTLDSKGEVQDIVGLTPINPAMVQYDASTPTWGSRFFIPAGLDLADYTVGAFQAGLGSKDAYDATTHQLLLASPTVATSQLKCESCHAPHGAATAPADGLNTMEAADGSLCTNCHN